MNNYYNYDFGDLKLTICCNKEGITEISLGFIDKNNYIKKETNLINKAYIQLNEYFNKKRKTFDLPLVINGTVFQNKVWNSLLTIPYGETKTYKEIAQMINCPKGYRAVGSANNKNKIMIVIPCHRVIGTNNKLVGYAGGIRVKKYLLDLEQE